MQESFPPDLDRTRAAFDSWRAAQPRRRRIPEYLWQQALSVLDRYPISRVAHTLRLDPKQLRQRKLSAAQRLPPDACNGHDFIEMPAVDLNIGSPVPQTMFNSSHHTAETDVRLIFERPDGCRLTLCLRASDWNRLTALCIEIIRH